MKCKQCGTELIEGASFCRRCGARADITPQNHVCPECGYEAKPWEKFCQRCGTKLHECGDSNETEFVRDEVEDSDYEERAGDKSRKSGWNKLDRPMQNEIIIGGFLLYLFALAYVAQNSFAIWISIVQFMLLTFLVFARQKNSKFNKPGVRPLIIGVMICFALLYLIRFAVYSA